MEDYDPEEFWNERFRRHGHTGEVDAALYAYDQPQRLRAIDKALALSKVRMDADIKILDIGCGTGDLISLLVQKGMFDITGIDVSDEIIQYARRRFANTREVRLLTMKVENMDFSPDSFDLVTGINVLQHIIDQEVFSRAVENMIRVLRLGGHVLVMDFSPAKVKHRRTHSYVTIRPRNEYIQAFESSGCKLIGEFGLPRMGVRLWRAISGATAKLASILPQSRTKIMRLFSNLPCHSERSEESRDPSLALRETTRRTDPILSQVYDLTMNLVRAIVLGLAKPFDYFLMPFPSRYTDMRILVFEKAAK